MTLVGRRVSSFGMAIVSLVFLSPMVLMVLTSVKPESEVLNPASLLPRHVTFANYAHVLGWSEEAAVRTLAPEQLLYFNQRIPWGDGSFLYGGLCDHPAAGTRGKSVSRNHRGFDDAARSAFSRSAVLAAQPNPLARHARGSDRARHRRRVGAFLC